MKGVPIYHYQQKSFELVLHSQDVPFDGAFVKSLHKNMSFGTTRKQQEPKTEKRETKRLGLQCGKRNNHHDLSAMENKPIRESMFSVKYRFPFHHSFEDGNHGPIFLASTSDTLFLASTSDTLCSVKKQKDSILFNSSSMSPCFV